MTIMNSYFIRLLLTIIILSISLQKIKVTSFIPQPSVCVKSLSVLSGDGYESMTTTTSLFATNKKKKKKNRGKASTSGFGGAAAEECPCGIGKGYMKCCGPLHKNVSELTKATPEQVVLARYTAYAKREIDFIIKSTHPLNENFQTDIAHWRKQIDTNCYDNFELTKCEIVDQSIIEEDKKATVTFVANMVQRDSRERTAFQETSTFEKIGGAWLYKEGKIEEPPGREAESTEDEDTRQELNES